MKHVLLVNPWVTDFAAYDFWSKPLGLLILGRILYNSGISCSLLDLMDRFHTVLADTSEKMPVPKNDGTGRYFKIPLNKPAVISHIKRTYSRYGWPENAAVNVLRNIQKPHVILMTSHMTYWYPGVQQTIALLKREFPDVPLVLGGIYATLCKEHAKKTSGADIIVSGPVEESLSIISDLFPEFKSSAHNSYKDSFVSPLYDLYPRLPAASIMTSRGCPYSCPFCASSLLFSGFIQRPVDDAVDEMVCLNKKRGTTHFAFADDALLINKSRHFMPIMEKIIEHNIAVSFHTPNGLQPRELDFDTAVLMKRAGFETIRLSFESSRPARQKEMGGKVSCSDMEKAVEACFKAGFTARQIGCYLLMGLPGQTAEEVVESICFAARLGIRIHPASFSPIPGTKSMKEAEAAGLFSAKFDPLVSNNSIYPLCGNNFNFGTFDKLRQLARISNQCILAGKSPFNHPGFLKLKDGLLNNNIS